MLYHSRWAPSRFDEKSTSYKTTGKDDATRHEPSTSSSATSGDKDFARWSDPALRLIDEETNRMDVDIQVSGHIAGLDPH